MPVLTVADATSDASGEVVFNLENELGLQSRMLQQYPMKSVQVVITSAGSVQLSVSQNGTNFRPVGSVITSSDWVTVDEAAKYFRVAWSGNTGNLSVFVGI